MRVEGQPDALTPKSYLGIVLQKEGGALKNLITPFWLRIGLSTPHLCDQLIEPFGLIVCIVITKKGGHIGSGEQWFAWIHMQDTVNALLFPLHSNVMTEFVDWIEFELNNQHICQDRGTVQCHCS